MLTPHGLHGGSESDPHEIHGGSKSDLHFIDPHDRCHAESPHATDEGCVLTYFIEFPPRSTPHGFHGGWISTPMVSMGGRMLTPHGFHGGSESDPA